MNSSSPCILCTPAAPSGRRLSAPAAGAPLTVELHGCAQHADVLRASVEAALRRASHEVSPSSRALRADESSDGVRRWARAHGLPIAAHGSLSRAVLDAYRSAHGAALPAPTG